MEDTVDEVYGGSILTVELAYNEGLVGKPLTIYATSKEEVFGSNFIVLEFQDHIDRLKLNRSNARILKKSWGNEFKSWVGRQLKIAVEPQPNGKQGLVVYPIPLAGDQ